MLYHQSFIVSAESDALAAARSATRYRFQTAGIPYAISSWRTSYAGYSLSTIALGAALLGRADY